jgi:hypothetical protein
VAALIRETRCCSIISASSASHAMQEKNLNIESTPVMKTTTTNLPARFFSVGFTGTAIFAAVAVLGFLSAAPTSLRADPPLPGAVFTTDSTCSGVDLNIYGSKGDVYVNGGPSHPGAAGLPDGSYCVQVTSPDGTVLGQSAAGAVSVSGGVFAQCYQLSSILNTATSGFTTPGYDDTNNPGGEYKVWVSTDCTFTNNSTKTDNFKVREGGGGPGQTATICVTKFYDANANGVKDGNEQDITGWLFQIFAHDNLQLTRETPRCVVVDPGTYAVIEGTPIELNWVHTTPTEVDVDVAANDTANVSFGNVCLGPGGGLTLGFWSNKNGQKLESTGDFTLLTGLCLRNATGGNQDFTASLANNKTALNTWLLNATATNMAYMLSAQLAAMELNVSHGFVGGAALVYEQCLTNYGYPTGFISINDLMTAANSELCAHGLTKDGSPYRAYQECLKNALDDANNNRNFVESSPCPFSFGN